MLRSRLALALGDAEAATVLARYAIEDVERTEWLAGHGQAWWRLADARLAAGDLAGAGEAARTALDRFETKGDVTTAAKVRGLLERIGEREPSAA